ncbi:MAG TPA: 1-phosphofructokinase family hexose kinase [Clostridia bacterium]|nr:1-phosphofructokinase family hexose kinase [Clostridia bacterium]
MTRVLTVTLNPSIDKTVYIKGFKLGATNYIENTHIDMGGKGINVSKALFNFGIDNIATGFMTESHVDKIDRIGIRNRFYLVEGALRVNTKINDLSTGTVTELNEKGFCIHKKDLTAFIELYEELCPKKGIVVLSGSIPKGVPDDIYAILIKIAKKKGSKTLLDAHGRFLVYGLKENPYAIKPNVFELESIVDRKLKDINDIVDAVKEIKDGATLIAVSMGKEGALFFKEGRFLFAETFPIQSISTVGAGDAMTAAMVLSIINGFDLDTTARFATCAGTMTCLKEGSNVCSHEDVLDNINRVSLKYLQEG